jgi:hypothetical protein
LKKKSNQEGNKMNGEKMKANLRFLFVVLLVVLTNLNQGSARIDCNQAGSGYEEGSTGNSITQIYTIEDHIVLGGSYSLKANSNVQELLKIVELKDVEGVNFDEVRGVVDGALENLVNAVKTYEALIARAEATPYNINVINRLKEFGYDEFRMTYGLNRVVFDRVEDYLRKGNITGVFKYKHAGLNDILALLTTVKSEIDQNRLPDLSLFWQLNEKFAGLSLFGSYVARVFYVIN